MADALTHLDVDSDEFDDAPKALRDYVKKLQKQNQSLSSDLDGLRSQAASRAIGEVLADKGFKNPKRVERDLLADRIDPLDTSAVESWLAENSDDYARAVAAPDAAAPEQETPNPDAAAFERLNGLNAQPSSGLSPIEAALAEAGPGASKEALRAAFIKHGV